MLVACSTTGSAERAQKKYEDARMVCFFNHGYGEAKVQHEGGSMAPVNDAFRECLQKAQADLDRELAEADAGHG
jgi:hypothetical protein